MSSVLRGARARARLATRGEVKQSAQEQLLQLLAEGATGCLAGMRNNADYRVYLMNGEIIAAHAAHDARRILELLHNRRILTAPQIADIHRRLETDSLTDLLSGHVTDELLASVFLDRFRENLFEFINLVERTDFAAQETIFVDNIQVGHSSAQLVQEMVRIREHIEHSNLNTDHQFRRGRTQPQPGEEIELLETMRDPISLEEALRRSPFERSRTLLLLISLLQRGVLTVRARDADPGSEAGRGSQSGSQDNRNLSGQSGIQDNRSPESRAQQADRPSQAGTRSGSYDRQSQAATQPALAGYVDHTVAARRGGLSSPAPQAPSPPPGAFGNRGDTLSPYEEEYLAAFGDYDQSRDGGNYSSSSHLLDKVALNEGDRAGGHTNGASTDFDPAKPQDPIEIGDVESAGKDALRGAVSLNFTGRLLEDYEIQHKLEVVNDILGAVASSINQSQPGAGNAQIQLLLEGAPGPYAQLFKGLEINVSGQIPLDPLLRNIRRRPPAEQRQLYNQGLSDLIERALSMAAENLEDEHMERTLENIAGYQQKFGL